MAWRQPTNLREWLAIVYRHKKKLFFPSIVVMIVVVIASHWIPREYRATAMFERINDAALEQMGSSTIDRNLRPIRQGLTQDIKGRPSIEQLIEDMHLMRDLPHTADGELTQEGQIAKFDLINKLTDRIEIRLRIRSDHLDQIVVSYNDPDRELAPKVVNKLVENYIRNTRKQLDEMLLNAKSFFEREVSRYRAKITELDSKKLRFELEHPGLSPDDPTSVETELVRLRGELTQASTQKDLATSKRAKLQEWVDEQPEFIEKSQTGQNPELVALNEKISDLENQLEAHLYQMNRTEEHPAVIRIKSRLVTLNEEKKGLDDSVVIGKQTEPNTNRLGAQREIETLSGIIVALERQIEEKSKEMEQKEIFKRNFFVIRNDYVQIERELLESKQQLQFWDENLRSTITALTAEIGQRGVRMRMLERAPDLARPAKPTLVGILMIAAVMGLGTGLLLVVLSELLNRSFQNAEQAVDELKLPVMGAVNEIITPREMFRRKVLGWGLYPTIATVMMLILLSSITLAHLSLSQPSRYEKIIRKPAQFLNQTLMGRF